MKYYSKSQQIIRLCRGRRVLHIGCVGFADLQTSERVALAENSLHFALTKCSETVGVDYSQEAIDYLRNQGIFSNVLYGNAEDLGQLGLSCDFDCIVAGDIIEHLSNPGLMLDGVRKLCNRDTRVIITTPHSFGLLTFFRFLLNRFVEGQEHVFTMNGQNLEILAKRHGFAIVELATCYQDHARGNILFEIGRRFFSTFPRFGGTLFCVLRTSS